MKASKNILRHPAWKISSMIMVAVLSIGGFFVPILGFGVLGLMAAALAMNFRKRRSFCAGACPNGTFLANALKPVSRRRKLPRVLVDPRFRRMLCGVMLFCMFGLIARGYPNAVAVGRAFQAIYALALSVGMIVGIWYRPRAWCAFCPLGTLQDTVRGGSKGA